MTNTDDIKIQVHSLDNKVGMLDSKIEKHITNDFYHLQLDVKSIKDKLNPKVVGYGGLITAIATLIGAIALLLR